MKEKKSVGFLTARDPNDKRSWSGTHYRMYKSLLNEFDEIYQFGPIKRNIILKIIVELINRLSLLFFSKKYNKQHNILTSLFYASRIKNQLKKKKLDVIFAPAASTEIAYLKTSLPICYLSDTSFGQVNEYYQTYSKISPFSVKESNIIEQRAIAKSTTQVYSSNWAAEYVIENYKGDRNTIFTVSYGANIDFVPNEVDIKKDFKSTINCLFLGVEWERKGGDIVLESFDILIEKGYDITLTICGCIPRNNINNPKIKIIPFLDKNKEDDYKRFLEVLYQTHILFVPTRADCTPIVFCEANAFGIPVITTDTGGVTAVIENGVNGYALPFESTPDDYADKIQTLLNDRNKLEELSLKTRERFKSELNWETWAKKMRKILLHTIEINN